MQKWYNRIEGSFDLPRRKSKDFEYYPYLEAELSRYVKHLEEVVKVPDNAIEEIRKICETIILSLDLYYDANIICAQKEIMKLLLGYKDNPFVFSDLRNSYAFRALAPFLSDKVQVDQEFKKDAFSNELSFFKARVSDDPTTRFKPEQMLHIKFSERGKIKTQRFSIAGIPCMYFGSTSYVCWLELGKPQNEFFNVCSYKIDESLKVLNLVCTWSLICGLTSAGSNEDSYKINLDDLVLDLLKLWPLVCATSFQIDEKNRSFKSEYIISQLIMLCLNELKIDAVAYISKQAYNDTIAYPNCVNLAIPVKHDNKHLSEVCKRIKVTNPVNFGEYTKLSAADRHTHKRSYINSLNHYYNHILLASTPIRYETSVYGSFDNFLVSFDHHKLDIDSLNQL